MAIADLGYLLTLPRFDHLEAKTLEEACSLLSQYKEKARVIAGGTDLLVLMKRREISPQYMINLKTIPNLDYIRYTDREGLRIGALTTLHEIECLPIIGERFPILVAAAHQIGSPHIRNVATIGGNLCNAAPSADTAPPLIALGARVEIKGLNTERTISLEDFFLGPGENALRTGEILTEIQIPNPPPNTQGTYLKLPARTVIDIAVVGVAVIITQHFKDIVDARIALGAVAPTPLRARKAEDMIKGKVVEQQLIEEVSQAAAEAAEPISDIRASADYRKEMVKVLTSRALKQVITPG